MPEVKRISNKASISNGTANTNLSLNDKLLSQHTSGDNADKSISILQSQLTPYGTSSTASATATKTVTMVNFPSDFVALVGTKIRVKFTYGNTASTQMYLKVGNLAAKPCTCRGIAMGAGSVLAGSKIEFMYDGEAWDCQLCEAISSMDITSKSPINSTALNGALANFIKVKVFSRENDIQYASDTVGSRAIQDNFGEISGMKQLLSLVITYNSNSADMHIEPFVSSGKVYVNVYRASTKAVTNGGYVVKSIYI